MENKKPFGTGAEESPLDERTYQYRDFAIGGLPKMSGGFVMPAENVLHQHNVGICTAISLVQNRGKVFNKKYSADFQYLLQKKFIDGGWWEGSSIFSALKVGKKYGFLPEKSWTHTNENDRYLDYSVYIKKLQAIPDDEVTRLLGLCENKISTYAQLNETDAVELAHAIEKSPAGILCRYGCQKNWWTAKDGRVSWDAADIDPLRNGRETSGHAIMMTQFDYTQEKAMQLLANTWGTSWATNGSCHIDWNNYPMTEAWVIFEETPKPLPIMIRYGMTHPQVKVVQQWLNNHGYVIAESGPGSPGKETKYFGPLTLSKVVEFQRENGLTADGIVGPATYKVMGF